MKTLKVKSGWLNEGDLRLDASFHLSEGRNILKLIGRAPCEVLRIGDVAEDIFYGGRSKRVYVSSPSKGVPFMGSADMLKQTLVSLKHISKKNTHDLDKYILKKEWILISRSGTVGNTVFTNNVYEKKAASEHIIRVVPNGKVKSGYLYAYLTSKYGYSLMTQGIFGAVIQHIEPDFISNLPIPILSKSVQQKVHDLIINASTLRENANESLERVQQLLIKQIDINEDELELLNSSHESDISQAFTISSKKLNPFTLRARNYSKRKELIIDHLKKGKYDKLIDVLKFPPFYGARFKRIESRSNNGIELLSQGDIFSLKPTGRKISRKSIKGLSNELVLRGSTLVPAQGTLGENEIFGRAKFVWGTLENKLVAGHAMRFIPDEKRIDPGYLHAILSSPLWFRILRDTVFGTNLLGFIVNLIQEYPIPRFSSAFEDKLSSLVKDACTKFTNANKIESQAIGIIENEISSWQK
jgi:hypothetical protein